MNDKELLEFAARAAGYYLRVEDGVLIAWEDHGSDMVGWNPLNDYGDALRLAVDLGFTIYVDAIFDQFVGVEISSHHLEHSFCELYSDYDAKLPAVCRAIVRAAAEIGKTL